MWSRCDPRDSIVSRDFDDVSAMRMNAVLLGLSTLAFVVIGATTTAADPVSASTGRTPSREIAVGRLGESFSSIWLVTLDGRQERRLSGRLDSCCVAWAPDGRTLAFSAGTAGVFLIGADGSRLRNVIKGRLVFPVVWSPDGRRIFLSSSEDDDWDIYSVNRDGSGMRNLTPHKGEPRVDDGEDGEFALSPDGKRIAFIRKPAIGRVPLEIWVMDANGSNKRNVTRTAKSGEFLPSWSPDGRRIAFVMSSNGHQAIYAINPNGTGRRRISPASAFPGFEWVTSYAWLPDGQSIVFGRVRRLVIDEVLSVTSDGRKQERLASGSWPTISPDGSMIAHEHQYATADGESEVWTMNSDGSGQRRLTVGSDPVWRP